MGILEINQVNCGTLTQKQSTIGQQSPGHVHSATCGQQGFQRAPGEPEQTASTLCAPFASGTKCLFLLLDSLQNLIKG